MPNNPAMPDITNPAHYVPSHALAFGQPGEDATFVDATHPLPVEVKLQAASGVTPLTGATSATGVLGPFAPLLGRPVWLTLDFATGAFVGTVTVKRSIDGGTTKTALTAGGQAWASFTGACNEQVVEPSESGETYYLDVTRISGTLGYRLAQ